ncbi:Protein-disulfide isomerase [Rhodovulum sp. ES.010]|uniref:DsbA family protein n=1 Tax=Rhodovulum sp. ES.010 TaxID=1882821 RepID=UPI00092C4B76|nr:thioredoxin domain-containing protein [Rhodovulum sp. ES.010]SIO29233.1 Protein-disulfide isomerase [Rhodovulum sp. ES.010]
MRRLAGASLAALLTAGAAPALELSAAERAAFRAELRAYLLEHPEVIEDALAAAEERRYATAARSDLDRIAAEAETLFHDPADWTGGDPQGDVTLVTFVDYACAACGPALAAARALAARDGRLRLVVKDAPGPGADARRAARFARAVLAVGGADTYARAQEALFAVSDLSQATLDAIARDLGLSPAALSTRLEAPDIAAALSANRALMDRLHLGAPPAHVLERTLIRGALPERALAAIAAAMRRKN